MLTLLTLAVLALTAAAPAVTTCFTGQCGG